MAGPLYMLTLQAEPGTDGVRALRGALKVLKRKFGLVLTSIDEYAEPKQTDGDTDRRRRRRTA